MSDDTKPAPTPVGTTLGDAPTVSVAIPDPPRPGDVPSGDRYRAQGVLGRGGMGEVRLVEDGLIGREVAVKTITPRLAGSRVMRERFLREVRIQGQLEHPSIVPVYDLGVDESGSDYFTMKRVAGRTLASVLEGLAAADPATVQAFPRNGLLAVFRQVCLAVAYAHSRGVVHRDLKPANVMIGDFGEVYVLDWGIARLAHEAVTPDADQVLGTPGYMAPEQQANGNDADERSDVYALGTILFELLALEPWHPTSSAAEAIASTSVEERARPAQRAPHRDIPIELDDLCARATTRERAERVQTARELADVVERYLEGDRDLERRRDQAQRHATAARAARARAAADGPAATEARREALREAGRALALDPDGREGLRDAIELMLEPPREVPAEVQHQLERAQSDRIRAGLVPGMIVFATFIIAALVMPLITGPVSWRAPLVIAATLTIAIVLCADLLRRENLSGETYSTFVIVACVSVAIAFASGYLGPMMIVPPLAVALTNALSTSQHRWRLHLTLVLLGVAAPSIAEWAGLVPRSYEFVGDSMVVRPVIMQLAETPVRLLMMFVTVAAIVGSVFYVRRVILVESELRRTWLLHNWHLREMARLETS